MQTFDCAKESLLSAMDALSNINSTDLLQLQIKEIYNKLEQMPIIEKN